MKWFDWLHEEEETEDITVVEAVEVPVVVLVEDTRVDPVVATKVVVLQVVDTKEGSDLLLVEVTREVVRQKEVLSVLHMEAIVHVHLVATRVVSDHLEDTRGIVLKGLLVDLHTEVTVHELVVTRVENDLPEGTRGVSDHLLVEGTREVVLSPTDSEVERIHSVGYLVEELLLLVLLTVLPTEAIVHKQTVLSSKGNERSEEITRKEHTKLLVIETMSEEPRKLGQPVKRKIYKPKKSLARMYGLEIFLGEEKFGLYRKIDTIGEI